MEMQNHQRDYGLLSTKVAQVMAISMFPCSFDHHLQQRANAGLWMLYLPHIFNYTMSSNDYFQIYIDTISEAFRRVRKIGFKKFSQIKDLIDTAQNFLSKEVYGRIEPANYLLAMIVILGSKTPKLYSPIISAVQRLFSYNFISPNEEVSGSLKLLTQDHREFLLLPLEDYSKKYFKQLYIETLVSLGEKDDGLNLSVAKSLSLIWRLDQNSIPLSLLPKIFDYILDSMAPNRLDEDEKMFKSALLEMFRHTLQSYREAFDRKLLYEENSVSLKGVSSKYGLILADRVAIQMDIFNRFGVENYPVIPRQNQSFKLLRSSEVNEKGLPSGKFGWCISCRNSANYYCMVNRLPVCSFECKQTLCNDFQSLEKFMNEEERSTEVFESHIVGLFNLFKNYLGHPDPRKKHCFAQVFMLMTSEIKKIADKLSPKAYRQLRGVVRQLAVNIYSQSQTFLPCMASLKKLLQLRIFLDQTQIILRLFAKKLTYFLASNTIRDEILKFIKEMIGNRILFDSAMALDCSPDHYDAVREIIDAVRQVYVGIIAPDNISVPPSQDMNTKKLSFEVAMLLLKSVQDNQKRMNHADSQRLVAAKAKLNLIRHNLDRFNKTEKPLKVAKKLIQQGFLPALPENISKFLHQNLKRLNPTNVGVLIGDIDEFAGQIRRCFIEDIHFANLPIDEGMRVLLKHFTLPGESQVVERIIEAFGVAFFKQNEIGGTLVNSDAVYSFSYLLMMLQSNLHNPQVIEKMTLPQFAKLSKGMNGAPDAEFPPEFLESIYLSVQRKPLGVHEKLKEIELIIAYNANPKKAQQIYLRDSQKETSESLSYIEESPVKYLPENSVYPLPIFIDEFVGQVIDILAWRIKDIDERDKQEIVKCLQLTETCLKISHQGKVSRLVERGIENVWQQIQRSTINKKYLLMQAMFEWTRKFGEHLNEQWKVVILLISKFYRSKSIRKDNNSNKANLSIAIIENKCFLYEAYIEQLIAKTTKYSLNNLVGFLRALLSVSRDEVNDGGYHFCLEKINQVLQLNASRSLDLMNAFWCELKEYYAELGKHKTQKIALFAADFLKQLITKFLKRKDLIGLQKQYLKPFEDIFSQTKIFAVKELVIGSLSYFVGYHALHLKNGWKLILNVTCNCFEEEEHQIIKEKAYGILKKIAESNFGIFNLEENYNDFVQILNRLGREKEENYALGCLQIIQQIVEYYHARMGINLEHGPDSPQNQRIDINFWQTVFLPLLSIIFPICGDSRTSVQQPAIECLFSILFKYGKLFKYQFWKMVLQGVLRPAFEEITYTSQSKPLKKGQLEVWLKNSFTQLFRSINELIVLYYQDFRLFLEDVFKIYENCILNHSLKLLIVLSMDALNDLLQRIAVNFEEHDWETYLFFAQSLLKKTLPVEITSLDAWTKSKDLLQNNYEAKCFALFVFMSKWQEIFDKFPESITEKIYNDTLKELEPIYLFVTEFNENIELRETLWKNGFYQDIKVLPGLIKHHYEIVKFKCKIYHKLIHIDQKYLPSFFQQVFFIFDSTKKLRMTEAAKGPSVLANQQERICNNFKLLLADTVIDQLLKMGPKFIEQGGASNRLLQAALSLLGTRQYCTRCLNCESCESSAENSRALSEQLQSIVLMLFKGR